MADFYDTSLTAAQKALQKQRQRRLEMGVAAPGGLSQRSAGEAPGVAVGANLPPMATMAYPQGSGDYMSGVVQNASNTWQQGNQGKAIGQFMRGAIAAPGVDFMERSDATDRAVLPATGVLPDMAAAGRGIGQFWSGLTGGESTPVPPTARTSALAGMPNRTAGDRSAGATPVYTRPQPAPEDTGPPVTTAPQARTIGSTGWDLAGQNARAAANLKMMNEIGTQPGGAFEAGYRGPMAPGRGIAGDFDFAANAARDFAARKGQSKKALALTEGIAARDAAARGDVAMAEYGKNQLAGAQAGLARAQGQEAAARGSQIAQLTPAQFALMQAQAGETQQRGGLYGAQATSLTGMQPLAQEGQSLANTLARLDVKGRQRVDELGTKLTAATEQKDIDKYNTQLLGLLGKSKPEEYSIEAKEIVDANGAKTPIFVVLNKRTGKTEVVNTGGGGPTPPENHILALKQDPSRAKDFDEKYGAGAAAKYLKG